MGSIDMALDLVSGDLVMVVVEEGGCTMVAFVDSMMSTKGSAVVVSVGMLVDTEVIAEVLVVEVIMVAVLVVFPVAGQMMDGVAETILGTLATTDVNMTAMWDKITCMMTLVMLRMGVLRLATAVVEMEIDTFVIFQGTI